jgi:NAD(P)H dehydrogenase (quinone)
MHVHLVHAHPEPRSFVAAMRDSMVSAFEARGDTVTVSDLYAMAFNPVASASDFQKSERPEHLVYSLEQRHAYRAGTLAPDISREVEQVLAADLVAFTFPVFWFGTPAILKGWVERVFLSGPFYGGRRIYGNGGLVGKRSFAAFSLGGRPHMFGKGALHGELENGMMRHFLQGTLGYVGMGVYEPFVAYHVPYIGHEARAELLGKLHSTVLAIDSRPMMPIPDLDAFDETFAPRTAGQ